MKLRGKKVAVLVENLYNEVELWVPYYRMKEEGAEVVLVGPKGATTYESKHGLPAKSDRAASEVDAAQLDAVIVPGGYAPDLMRRDRAMLDLLRAADRRGAVVAAICHAGWVLASAGILAGRRATCYSSIKDDVANAGAKYVDEEVVVDGNLITSRAPADLPAFCRAIVTALAGPAEAGRFPD